MLPDIDHFDFLWNCQLGQMIALETKVVICPEITKVVICPDIT